ncbi:hypothetical protein DFH06DRAFT_1475322 [Mycena polygramma]|nr:hypothetical protein DFH06DRAFT_1475322 [Mycena polygramma]
MAAVCDSCGQCNTWTLSSASPVESPSEYSPVQLRSNLDEVTAEIVRHKAYMNALQDKRRELEMQLARIVYPVLSIPPEIVSKFFVACLPSHGRVRPSPLTPPLTLAQVCSYWREIALSSCELWSSLDLLLPLNYDQTPRKYRDFPDGKSYINRMRGMRSLQETWWARAKEQPLSLTIRSLESGFFSNLSKVLPCGWTGSSPRAYTSQRRPSPSGRNLPCISASQAFSHMPHGKLLIILPFSVLPDAPAMSELRLGDVPALMSNLSPLLATLELRQISVETLILTMGDQYQLPQIASPLLQSLILHGSSIESLNLPKLRRLELYKDRYMIFPPISLFDSNPVIEHLGLASGKSWEFVECLRRSPPSLSLLVHVDDHISWFAEVMARDPPLVPRLSTLIIHASFDARAESPPLRFRRSWPLFGFIYATSGGIPLKDWVLPRGAIAQLRPLLDEGLDLRVIYNNTHGWPDADFCESFP